MIEFSLPGYWNKFNLNVQLIKLYEEERFKFRDNIIIDNFYDSFPCIWNGGRMIEGFVNVDNIINTVNFYNSKNFGLRHTFTNNLISSTDLNDTVANIICRISEKSINGITCNSDLLKNYIENNYPNFYFLYSTTLNLSDINKINELSKNNIVILNYNFNNNFEKLTLLKYPQNIEILIGESCIDNCPDRQQHYKITNENQKNLSNYSFICPNNCDGDWDYYRYIPKRKHFISIEDIENKYLPLGFTKFKISGRKDNNINTLERYINYLVKPDYKDEIRNRILLKLYK